MVKLNLGCGKVHLEGFINIDCDPAVRPNLVALVDDLSLQYKDGEVDEIVAYDIVEHFDRTQFPKVLSHWFSLLKPGGVLHLRTNDLDRLVRMYAVELFCRQSSIMTTETFAWHLFSEHENGKMGHKWIFNRRTLTSALMDAGFKRVEFASDSDMARGVYFLASCQDFSNMYVKATKVVVDHGGFPR